MGYYYSKSGNSINLYQVNSTYFPTSGGTYPATSTSGKPGCSYDTGWRINGNAIYQYRQADFYPYASSSTTTTGMKIYPGNSSYPGFQVRMDGSINDSLSYYTLWTNGSSHEIYIHTNTSSNTGGSYKGKNSITGNSYYTNSNCSAGTAYYLRTYHSSYGGYGAFQTTSIKYCTSSTTASTCCSSSNSSCVCSTNTSCPGGSSSMNCSCSSSKACVIADTLILTKNGYKLAKDVKKGDIVLALQNNVLKEDIIETVYKVSTEREIYKVVIEGNKDLLITENHPILCDNNIYKSISGYNFAKLQIGDRVTTVDGLKIIKSIISYCNYSDVYNFLLNSDNFIANDVVIACESMKYEPENTFIVMTDDYAAKCCNSVSEGVSTCDLVAKFL